MNIYVISIQHKRGIDMFAFKSEKKAHKKLYEWAKEWWATDVGTPFPDELCKEDAVAAYFERVKGRESYNLRLLTLD